MLFSSWSRLWGKKHNVLGSRRLPAQGSTFIRPQLEPLEDRVTPSAWAGVIGAYAAEAPAVARLVPAAAAPITSPTGRAPAANGGLKPPPGASPEVGGPMTVVYVEDSAAARIDLGAAFGTVGGLRRQDGLQLTMLGNSNPALVKANLSEQELTLTFAPGKSGKATITLSATDADGVSVRETVLVSVLPHLPAGAGEGPPAAGAKELLGAGR